MVVNAPQNPIVRPPRSSGEITVEPVANLMMKPSRNEPAMLIARVPVGNVPPRVCRAPWRKYRARVPRMPPRVTYAIIFHRLGGGRLQPRGHPGADPGPLVRDRAASRDRGARCRMRQAGGRAGLRPGPPIPRLPPRLA